MLTLQSAGIRSKAENNTGYYVQSHIHVATPANCSEKHERAANFHIWPQWHSEFIAWSATGIPRKKQDNWLKANELEHDEMRDEFRRTKMIIIQMVTITISPNF